MIVPPTNVRVLIATKAVNFRRGIMGLAVIVEAEFKADPFSGVIYVFRSKRGDRIKVLFRDGTGICLLIKRLESKFRSPRIEDGVMRQL
ncbi:IS66 Orf2 family protein [Rhodomicrobium vannielii ATCC 17100]|uniref:IS66 Orf2 family protein n=2 Tax=Rhodomicrobium vannielii TaxID=1069 RepID=E3I7R7_RHOVT|nr:IS66 family insertion sequence element accessory protein TnpB [Rhodomicrobium vannielii]ADP69683.1 IS66 Orf2 family protein [Rhodomicrobium vannielii ATCC 17100]